MTESLEKVCFVTLVVTSTHGNLGQPNHALIVVAVKGRTAGMKGQHKVTAMKVHFRLSEPRTCWTVLAHYHSGSMLYLDLYF